MNATCQSILQGRHVARVSAVTDVRAHLEAHLHGMATPFLFVGSGLSRRYVHSDGWEDLLRRFAGETELPYEYYRTSAGEDLPSVASAIAEKFHEVWWRDVRFEQSRKQWGAQIRNRESALKVEVAKYLSHASDLLPTTGPIADELEILRSAVIDGIITTNFDSVLEVIFPDLLPFVGQDQMLFANPQGVGEIYKIHGCCTDPDSLVLTAADYDRFESRNSYLAAKLLTIFVEHPILFLGYSLSDRNIVSILKSITGCLTEDNLAQLENRLIFVQWGEGVDPSVDAHTMYLDGAVVPVQRIRVPDFRPVFAALSSLRRAYPAKILRRLKEQVYDLVLTDDSRGQLLVADIDDRTKDDEIDIVFGVGLRSQFGRQGYVGLDRWDLINDVVDDDQRLDAGVVVDEVLPRIVRGAGNVPVFKYLRLAGRLDEDGRFDESNVPPAVAELAQKNFGGMPSDAYHKRKAPDILRTVSGVSELEEIYGVDGVLGYVTCMDADKVDIAELWAFVRTHRKFGKGSWQNTQYVKLVCFLDWLKYWHEGIVKLGDSENAE